MDYVDKLDMDIRAFIEETLSFYPDDLQPDDWEGQRAVYDRMAAHFHAGRSEDLIVLDGQIEDVPVRFYGQKTSIIIIYAHGGGFVLGGLESHDDVCAEIAEATGLQVVSVDYRLAPENPHPAAYDDLRKVAERIASSAKIILCGDSAGGNLCASLSGSWTSPSLLAQVLIYPSLGYEPVGGSYDFHANAPLLTTQDVIAYADIRGGAPDDPRSVPKAGDLASLPPTYLFPAECDPLCDDCLRYQEEATLAGSSAEYQLGKGLVHGWLRARHRSLAASREFRSILRTLRRFVPRTD